MQPEPAHVVALRAAIARNDPQDHWFEQRGTGEIICAGGDAYRARVGEESVREISVDEAAVLVDREGHRDAAIELAGMRVPIAVADIPVEGLFSAAELPAGDESGIRPRPLLTILICGMTTRLALLSNLIKRLAPQLKANPATVELMIDIDGGIDRTGIPIGEKRNRLVARANGRFICFVDDDDLVSERYVALIVEAIRADTTVDCIGMKGLLLRIEQKGHKPELFVHSLKYTDWHEEGGVYCRCPNHLNPVAARHVKSLLFEPNNVEDQPWSKRLRPQLRTETMIDEPIYEYRARSHGRPGD